MECFICLNDYDHSVHLPKSLSCPHTICSSCLERIHDSRCPHCRTPITIVNTNLGLLALVPDLLQSANEVRQLKKAQLDQHIANLNRQCAEMTLMREKIKQEGKLNVIFVC